MKKLFALILLLTSPVLADINVTQGSGKTVHTDTVNGLEYQAVKIIDGTTGGTSSMTVTSANAALVTAIQSTMGVVNGGNTFNVNNFVQNLSTITTNGTGIPVTSTYTTVVSTGLPVFTLPSTPLAVQITTAAVGGSSITIANWGIAPVLTGGQNGSVGVGGLATVGSSVGGRPVSMGIVASSTAFQTTLGDQKVGWVAGDNIGRILTSGMPYWNISSTYSVNVSSQNTQEFIIISSATAPNYIYLCGCAFNNSSATNSFVTLYQSSSTVVGVDAFQIGTPANDVNAGVWPGCSNPFFRSQVGGQITLRANAAVSNTSMRCQYYIAP